MSTAQCQIATEVDSGHTWSRSRTSLSTYWKSRWAPREQPLGEEGNKPWADHLDRSTDLKRQSIAEHCKNGIEYGSILYSNGCQRRYVKHKTADDTHTKKFTPQQKWANKNNLLFLWSLHQFSHWSSNWKINGILFFLDKVALSCTCNL